MTEEEWLSTDEGAQIPSAHLDALAEQFPPRKMKTTKAARDRKLRLFASAALRRVWHLLHAAEWRQLVAASDEYADGKVTKRELRAADKRARAVPTLAAEGLSGARMYAETAAGWLAKADYLFWVNSTVDDIYGATVNDPDSNEEEGAYQQQLLRDIFGNPFRPVAFNPAWRTETAVGLARRIYDDRDFATMPILADALEEADCENADILSHCRKPGVHVRGCWVVDLVLGKV